jgi:hypothetical protein
VTALSRSAKLPEEPHELNQWRIDLSNDDAELLELYSQLIEMVYWFHTAFHRSSSKDSTAFRTAILSYFWDEWLTIDEQKWLIYSSSVNVDECIAYSQYRFPEKVVNRFIDPVTGILQYICEGNTRCEEGFVAAIARSKKDTIQTLRINTNSTGDFYGLLVPINGKYIFKTDVPLGKFDMITFRGKQCANTTNMTGHIANLDQLGDLLEQYTENRFDLTRNVLIITRKIKNSRRACVLMDIVLRYMDAAGMDGKRWFYRPVEAAYIGYKGTFRSSK